MNYSMINMTNAIRRKASINATVTPYLKRRLEALAEEQDDFTSLSDVVAVACQDFLTRYEANKQT